MTSHTMTPMDERVPLSPAEFDAAKRELERRCPFLNATSGRRTAEHNRRVGGHPRSKHLIGMAQDYDADSDDDLAAAQKVAKSLGLWTKLSNCLHVQGLPVGEVPYWWTLKYGSQV